MQHKGPHRDRRKIYPLPYKEGSNGAELADCTVRRCHTALKARIGDLMFSMLVLDLNTTVSISDFRMAVAIASIADLLAGWKTEMAIE